MRISSGDADAGIQISAGNAGIANKIQLSAKAKAASAEKQLSAGGGKERQKPEPGVTLMTMHGSKGLEFERVFLPDVNEGIIPGKNVITESAIEEERRLLYVAMTRAKEELNIYCTKERGRKPSRYLEGLVQCPNKVSC